MRAAASAALFLALASSAPAQDTASADPYEALEQEFRKARSDFFKRYRKARTDDERRSLRAEAYPVPAFEQRFLELADKERKRPAALKALVWVLGVGRSLEARRRALERINKDHADDPKLAEHLSLIAESPGGEDSLRSLIRQSSVRSIKGRARYLLAQLLVRSRRDVSVDREAEAVALLRKVIAEDSELPAGEVSLGERARGALFQITELRPGRAVPEIKGPALDGRALALRAALGKKPGLLLFWSGDDLDSGDLPALLGALEKRYPGKLAMVGVALDEPEEARKAASEAALRWPSFADEEGSIAEGWGVFDSPQVLLIDAEGRIFSRLGSINRLRQQVARLLSD